jgi:excisionase family DNA binding protein
MSSKTLINYQQLSAFLGMPVGTLQWLVHQERIPFIRIGPRSVRFVQEDIVLWIESRKCLPKGIKNER